MSISSFKSQLLAPASLAVICDHKDLTKKHPMQLLKWSVSVRKFSWKLTILQLLWGQVLNTQIDINEIQSKIIKVKSTILKTVLKRMYQRFWVWQYASSHKVGNSIHHVFLTDDDILLVINSAPLFNIARDHLICNPYPPTGFFMANID